MAHTSFFWKQRPETENLLMKSYLFIHPVSPIVHWSKAKNPSSQLLSTEANERPVDRSDFGHLYCMSTLVMGHWNQEFYEVTFASLQAGKTFSCFPPSLWVRIWVYKELYQKSESSLEISILHQLVPSCLVPYTNAWIDNMVRIHHRMEN